MPILSLTLLKAFCNNCTYDSILRLGSYILKSTDDSFKFHLNKVYGRGGTMLTSPFITQSTHTFATILSIISINSCFEHN